MKNLIENISEKLGMNSQQINNILKLLDEGATIPFIARYRKDMTGNASDELLRNFFELYTYDKKLLERKEEVKRLISERGNLDDKLILSIDKATTLSALEDIYRPFKEKKNSKAATAIKQGLEPLANLLSSGRLSVDELEHKAKSFVKGELKSSKEAIKGAQDIIAERFSDSPKEREVLRRTLLQQATLVTKATKTFDEKGAFKGFKAHEERLQYVPSHRYLAMMRALKEKELSVKISFDDKRYLENMKNFKIKSHFESSKSLLFDAYKDGFKRLLLPSIEREVHNILKERSDEAAISLFGKNLSQLLLTPPVSKKVILGLDPGFKTGCKLAVIDEHGTFLDADVIFLLTDKQVQEARKKVLDLVKKHHINAVAIGNGTASRESQEFLASINESIELPYTVVSEAGASVYSASKLALEEYPDLDVTIRGAISIAQRLQEPLSALVKIDPKSLGIGQYQHDVDQKRLENKLHEVIEALVNQVGVDLNAASSRLLSFVAGIGPKLANEIVKYRDEVGSFKNKKELLKVKGLGAKAYEQCAGFMRIRDAKELLDSTGVHPESFTIAKQILKDYEINSVKAEDLKSLGVGVETLKDIISELRKPGFDPRDDLPAIPFKQDVLKLEDLKAGSFVSGVVRSIVDFGAFVDIGLKNDGMIHISKMSEKRVSHPLEVLSVNQYLPQIEVIEVDSERGKVALSLNS